MESLRNNQKLGDGTDKRRPERTEERAGRRGAEAVPEGASLALGPSSAPGWTQLVPAVVLSSHFHETSLPDDRTRWYQVGGPEATSYPPTESQPHHILQEDSLPELC